MIFILFFYQIWRPRAIQRAGIVWSRLLGCRKHRTSCETPRRSSTPPWHWLGNIRGRHCWFQLRKRWERSAAQPPQQEKLIVPFWAAAFSTWFWLLWRFASAGPTPSRTSARQLQQSGFRCGSMFQRDPEARRKCQKNEPRYRTQKRQSSYQKGIAGWRWYRWFVRSRRYIGFKRKV